MNADKWERRKRFVCVLAFFGKKGEGGEGEIGGRGKKLTVFMTDIPLLYEQLASSV